MGNSINRMCCEDSDMKNSPSEPISSYPSFSPSSQIVLSKDNPINFITF